VNRSPGDHRPGDRAASAPSVPGANDLPLSVVLRQSSAADHRALEDLIGSEISPDIYPSFLLMFRALHQAAAGWRCSFAADCDRQGVPEAQAGLVGLIDRDLETLGLRLPPPWTAPFAPALEGFAMILGGLYVATGSALGNTLILRQIRASPDVIHADATAFLSASADEAGPRFRALRLALDGFGATAPAERDGVAEGARRTFRACAATFRSRA
jgi:heme oxygenase